jgi:uncharacterized protein (TIGR03435 family)
MIRAALILAFVGSVGVVSSQTPDPPLAPTFEVTSVKPAPKDLPPPGILQSPDRFYRASITLLNLINYAYDIRGFRIAGGPDWVAADRWEVWSRSRSECCD